MRNVLAVIVVAVFGYSAYHLLQLQPSAGETYLQMLWSLRESGQFYYVIAALVSFILLLVLAIRETKIVYEEARLNNIYKSINRNIEFVTKLEGRYETAVALKTALLTQKARIMVLADLSNGLPATLSQVLALHKAQNKQLEVASQDSEGNDVILLVSDAEQDSTKLSTDITSAEDAFKKIPELLASAHAFGARIERLARDKGDLFMQMDELREKLAELMDEDNGGLASIEKGDETQSETGDLDDQVGQLESDFDEMKARVDDLEEIVQRFQILKNDLAAFAQSQKPILNAAQ